MRKTNHIIAVNNHNSDIILQKTDIHIIGSTLLTFTIHVYSLTAFADVKYGIYPSVMFSLLIKVYAVFSLIFASSSFSQGSVSQSNVGGQPRFENSYRFTLIFDLSLFFSFSMLKVKMNVILFYAKWKINL